jgi:hypothetical protein
MKKVFLNVWKKALVLSLAAITFVITACGEDSGLGSTVDTEAPKIEITYPPLGANIRGTFVLAGSCDDDKSVKSIIVTVTDTTTKKVVGTVPASIENGGKSWKASVNNYSENDKKYDYLDGNYQFTAEIHDGAGHKNSASRTFDLDNTAPVFVASNPGVIKSQNKKASAYGSIFTIDGTIADDHTIASLTAKIFDENGNLIGNYKEEDIATAGGTSVTIASHYVDKGDGTAQTEQNNRYTQIYGDNDEAGTKQYYCTVFVEDNTKSYTNPSESENTTSGNITSEIYLYDSVYKSLMSTKSGNRYGLSAADFMTLLNGTRAKDEKTETALKILKEVVVDTGLEAESDKDENKLSFSLNPMANPTYSVNGFAVSKDAGGNAAYKEAFSDSTVVVSVNAGLDKTAILPGNLKVWTVLVDGLSPEDAQKRVNLVANKVTALQKIHSTVDEVHERADEIIDGAIKYADKEFGVGSLALVKDNSDDTGASVQTETLSCVLPKDTYISGKVYAFVVTGYDEDDVAFLHNTLYAFKANEAGIAPTLIITEPVNQSYIKTTEGLVFKGKTYLPDGSTLKVSSLKINLHVQDENKQNIAVGNEDGYTVTLTYDEATGYSSTDDSLEYDPESKIWTFTPSKMAGYAEISANEGEGKSYFYTLDITSESSSGNAASKTLSVHIDATMPTVSIANVTPCVSGKTFYSESGENIRNYVNGDISVKFNIEETNLKEVSYKVLVDGEEKVPSVSLGRQFSGSIDLDTTKWSASATEKKDFEVIITAVDTCGNTTSYSTTEYNTVTYNKSETETATFNKPIIICQETDIPQIKFNNTAELSYTTEKDGKIIEHSFLVIEEPKGATEEQKAEIAKKNAENKKSIVATHNLFNIENNNTIQIALEDDDNIASATVKIYDEDGKLYEATGFKNPSTLQVNKTSHTWNYVLPSKEGIYQIYVEVTDTKLKDDLSETVKLWRKNSVGKFFVAVDAGAPTVEIKTPVANSYQKVAFAASGTVSEKANITLERAIYKTGTEPKFVDVTGKIGAEKDGKYPWAETDADIKDLSDGDYILSYRATDRYEQSSTVSVNVKVDTKAPEFLDNESYVYVAADAQAGKSYVESTWYNNEAINIKGKFLEANGISNIYYWLDKDVGSLDTATGSFTAVTEEEKNDKGEVERVVSSYKTTISGFTECSIENAHKLTLVAVDLAGNESEKIEYPSIKVDMTHPTFENYYYKMGTVKGEVSGNILTNGENNVTLYGLISDGASGVDVNKLVLNVVAGTTKSILADTQTVKNITFTTEPTSWTEGEGANQKTVNVGTTEGFEKWIEKADAATATTFKDGDSIEDATKITGWKAVISKNSFKTGDVRTDYFDKAGNGNNNYKMFSIRVDKDSPELKNYSLKDEKAGYSAYKTKDFEVTVGTGDDAKTTELPHYYVNNGADHTFALEGIATDNEGISKVELVDSTGVIKTSEKGEFKWTGISLSSLDSGGNITIKITDIANNEFEQKIHITIDTLAPSGVHDTVSDSNHKDTIFRVGDADNILEEVQSSSNRSTVTALTTADKDVGGKYAPGTYGKSNSIKIRGQFKEDGSGLKEIYYKIFQKTPPTSEQITAFISDYENNKSGVFAPLSSKLDDPANDKRLVKVNSSDTGYSYTEIQSNYKMSIAGFAEGKNYLVVAAVDNVGNIALDNVTYKYTPAGETSEVSLDGCYSINVDTVTPELVEGSVTAKIGTTDKTPSGILTNFADGDISLAGVASDEDSGVEKIVLSVKVGNENKIVKTTLTDDSTDTKKKNWTAAVDATWFSDTESGNFTVYANITDKAGMGTNPTVATIIVDKKAPDVVLEKPTDADTSATESAAGIQINGIINLKGTINDENVLPTPAITAIEYKEKTATEWTTLTADSHTQMPNLALSGSYTFYANSFDTRALTDGNEYYIRARGVDSANNEGLSDEVAANEVLVKVDQDTDRPLIKITTLDSNVDPTTSSEVIQGTVSDDDGVAKFEYKDGAVTDDEWHEVTLNSGSWRIEGLASGKHQIKFRVTDSAGTVFETGKASFADSETHFTETGYPYVAYGKNDKIINDAVVSFAVDLNAPVVESIAIASTTSTTEPTEPAADSTTPNPYGVTKSFGANAKYMWIKALAKEDVALNPIADVAKDVTLKVGKDTIDVTDKVKRTGDDYGYEDTDAGFTYIIGPIDTSTFTSEGTLTVALVINDKSKRASDAKTANIYIDMTAPEVTVTSPNVSEGKSSDSIIGTTVLRGQISDSSTIAKFFYMIPTQAQLGASGIFASLTAEGTGYTYSDSHLASASNPDGWWIDINGVYTSKGIKNNYKDHTSMLWEIPVTSSKFVAESTDGLSLIEYATAKEGTSLKYAEVSNIESSVNEADTPESDKKYCRYVPLYFYTEDETGVSKVTATKILVDPYAGIPRLEISAPEENFAKTGGNLNFQGRVNDDAGDADKVVLTKLEFSTVDAVEADFVGATAKADSTFKWKEVSREILAESGVVTKGTLSTTDATITAEGKPSSWKISINTSAISTAATGNLATLLGTQGSGDDEEAKDIKITRATFVAYDKNGTASTFQVERLASDGSPLVKNIFVDKNAPKLKDIQLVQYDTVPTSATVATAVPALSRSYSAGMYISHNNGNGDWYLKGTITDDASVVGLTISSGKAYIPLSGKAEKGKTATGGIITSTLGENKVTFIIPISTENAALKNGNNKTCTQFYPTIELDDGQHTDVTQNLSFNVDNTAPGMYLKDDEDEIPNDELGTDAEKLRLKDFNGLVVGTKNVVENSDGSYTFGDMIKEAGSGLAYVVFWFEKGGKYYSAVPQKGSISKIAEDGLAFDGTTVKTDDNLPVLAATVTRPAVTEEKALYKINYTIPTAYTEYIRVGSLVKIGGSYHLISEISDSTITLEDEVERNFTSAEFVLAQVVNHQVTEGLTAISATDAPNGVSNDDGDGLAEMVKQSGSNYKWSATIKSDLINDGPATIHVVAFDEAGNVNSGYVATSIQNNRPRISKVFLGTDLNGNGTFDYFSETATGAVAANNELYPGYAGNGTEYGELSFYSALSSDGKIQGNVTLKSSNFVAKDKLLVLPEIIGGNTTATEDLKYLYKVVDEASGTNVSKDANATITKLGDTGAGTLKALSMTVDSLKLADKTGTAQTVEGLLGANHKADKWNYYDTTQGDYKGEDNTHGGVVTGKYKGLVLDNVTLENYESWTSGQAAGKVKYFAFTIWDATEGTEQGKTSLYALLKIPMVVNVVDDIAPTAQIHPFYWNSKEDGSFYYDADGVAEGHIDIDAGTVSTRPGVSGKVWIKATVNDETRLKTAVFKDPSGQQRTVAKYDGTWTTLSKNTPYTGETAWPVNWGEVELLETPEPNQAGHTMSFRVAIDMTSYGLATNKTVDVGATDKEDTSSVMNSETNTIAQTIRTALTSHYIMDFVPYIKSIYPATESSASRSRLGKFPVQAGKPMIIEGMNFKADAEYEYAVEFDTSAKNEEIKTDPDNIWESAEGYYIEDSAITKIENGKISLTAPQYSRYVRVWVKPKDGDWSYTRNNLNENLGCDIEEGYVAGEYRLNGQTYEDKGFAKANDAGTNFWTDDRYIAVWNVDVSDTVPDNLKPINGFIKEIPDDTLYRRISDGWDIKKVNNTVKKGNLLASWASTDDLQMYDYVLGSSIDTSGRTFGITEATFFEAPPYSDMTIINHIPWYVALDNYVAGDSANVWGMGLMVARQGYKFGRCAANAQADSYWQVAEFQGSTDAPNARATNVTGIDYKKNQFQNPHIAGYYNGNDGYTYVFVSYYDSFARCLKYAAFHEKVVIKPDQNNKGEDTISPSGFGNSWNQELNSENNKTFGVDARAADNPKDGHTVIAGSKRTQNSDPYGETAGEWNDIAMDSSNRPIIVYYNRSNKCLEFVRGSITDVSSNAKDDNKRKRIDVTWSQFATYKPAASSDFGRYVSMVIDSHDNIHIAAQDVTNGKLYYACLNSSGDLISENLVDATSSVGRWTDIELTKPNATVTTGLECEPVISYLDSSRLDTKQAVKVAFVEAYTENSVKKYRWDAVTDAAMYESNDSKTSIVAGAYESYASTKATKLAVGFNSTQFAVDFLRDE